MTEAKHTPGPWLARQDGEHWEVYSEDWGGIVTRHCYPDAKVDTNVEADARLIARAPDLLAENERLRGALEAWGGLAWHGNDERAYTDLPKERFDALHEQTRAALEGGE